MIGGLNIFGDVSGVSMFTLMGMCGELLLYQRIFLPGKGKVFVVELAYKSMARFILETDHPSRTSLGKER